MANRINVVLGLDLSQFTRAVNQMERQLGRISTSLQNVGSTLTQSLTLPIAAMGGASLKAFADLEKLNKGLVAIMGSSELAADELTRLREVAKLPGLGLKEAVQGSINLQAVGLSADEARSTLMGFGKALAATGKGKVELEAIQYQLTQMISKNKLLAEDYKVIQSNLPLMAKGMEMAFGTSNIENIRAAGISAKEFALRLSDALGKMPETQNVTGGLANAFENLQDSVFIAASQIGEAINRSLNLEKVLSKVGVAVQRVADWFTSLSPAMQKVIVISGLIVSSIGPLLFVLGKMTAIIPGVISGVKALGAAFTFMTGPVGLVIAAIGAVVAAAVYAYSKFEGFRRVVNGLGNTFKELFKLLKEGGAAFIRAFGELKEGEFRKAAASIEEGLRKTNPVTLAFTEGKRLKKAFTDGFSDDTNYLKRVQDEFKKATSGSSFTSSPSQPSAEPSGKASASRAEPVGLKYQSQRLRMFADEVQKNMVDRTRQSVEGFRSTLSQIESVESPVVKTEKALKQWSDAMQLASDKSQVFGASRLSLVQEQINLTGNAIEDAVEKFGLNSLAVEELISKYADLKAELEGLAKVQEFGAAINDAFVSSFNAGAAAVNQAGATIKSVMKAIGRAALQSASDFAKAEIIKGVTSVIAKTLASAGPLGIFIAGAAGAAAGAIFQAAINGITAPKLARGGITTGETLAVVGDNPSGKEAIIPFERMGEFLKMADNGRQEISVTGIFEVRGQDLVLVLDRAQKQLNRVR